ncbi:thiosulfate dehydrogenase [quinone] large subunit [Streptacidiphilus sp. MAP12-16]|uniref:DoxX family membrane protein n=1 Tax=Streptacidiphilus sp. MAP12-16 TaxID=3156300 RepID=UPI003513BEEE
MSEQGTGGRGAGLREQGARYALLPLRIFLGITFVYAGLDKLTDSHYLAGLGDPLSFAAMTQGVKSGSPIGPLLDLALKAPTAFALAIAIGELAVGLGALFGLLGRVAAFGGVLLNLSFFLTVSWQVHPYYLGNDLIYLMAWVPLVLAGTPFLSLDGWLAARRRVQPAQVLEPVRP